NDNDIRSQVVLVNGVRMHYLEAGHGRPVLLLHGDPRVVVPLAQRSSSMKLSRTQPLPLWMSSRVTDGLRVWRASAKSKELRCQTHSSLRLRKERSMMPVHFRTPKVRAFSLIMDAGSTKMAFRESPTKADSSRGRSWIRAPWLVGMARSSMRRYGAATT